jgi:hypothetical protein
MLFCKCGCGKEIPESDSRGRPRRFVAGHHNKVREYSHEYPKALENFRFRRGHTPHNKGSIGYMSGSQNPFYGKKHTEEARQKM